MSKLLLKGLVADNPIGFMAACGTLSVVVRTEPAATLHWTDTEIGWRPVLELPQNLDATGLVTWLHEALYRDARNIEARRIALHKAEEKAKTVKNDAKKDYKKAKDALPKALPKDEREKRLAPYEAAVTDTSRIYAEKLAALRTVAADVAVEPGQTIKHIGVTPFRAYTLRGYNEASCQDRYLADYMTAYGSEVFGQPGALEVEPTTALDKARGIGKVYLLGSIDKIMCSITPARLHAALFEEWDYMDKGLQSRWDPQDITLEAHEDNERRSTVVKSGKRITVLAGNTMHGVSLLAFCSLPLFPTAVRGRRLATTATAQTRNTIYMTWPVWCYPVSLDVLRSLLTLDELHNLVVAHDKLVPRGITAVYRSEHLHLGKYDYLGYGYAV